MLSDVGSLINEFMPEQISQLIHVSSEYKKAVGSRISKLSHPVKYDGKRLVVAVYDNMWLQELSFLKQDIIDTLEAKGIKVNDIKFVHKYKPFSNNQLHYKKKISERESIYIERFGGFIDDDELRKAYKKALSAYFEKYSLRDFFS